MSKHVATCGHEIDEGISCSIDDGQIFSDGGRAVSYGTYCADCLLNHYYDGSIRNGDMEKLIENAVKNCSLKPKRNL